MKPALSQAAIALASALSLVFPFAASARAETPQPVATILEVEGPVTWRAAQETAFHDAHGGENLFAGALVRTGPRGNAHLKWRNGGDFRLMPLSELAVPEDEGVLLNAGKIWAQFQQKLLVPFYFKSPSATAVVRGTTLGVEIGPQGDTTVAVLEGRVEVSSAHGGPSRLLEPGQSLTISPFGQLGPIQPVEPGVRLFERMGPPPGPPMREPEPSRTRFEGAVDWLQHNRASERLEMVRQEELRARAYRAESGFTERMPGGRRVERPGEIIIRERVIGVSPDRAFPDSRPQGPDTRRPPEPYCDPIYLQTHPDAKVDCPTPPPPPPKPEMGGVR